MSEIPQFALKAIELLEKNGFEAFLVGGCVRDFIMDILPHDFDITTNALPDQIKEIFAEYKTILTGEKHGTVAVIIDGNAVEITTYRVDIGYSDGRHPDNISFSTSLSEDLKRRDFTMNAIAMDKKGNIIDPFNGRADIEKGIIRIVGETEKRFEEDALRIMRAVRFSSRLGFEIEEKTFLAIENKRDLLRNISSERICSEFIGTLMGEYVEQSLRKNRDVIAVFIPEITKCFDFEQHSPYHKYDVWEHTIHAVGKSAKKERVRIAMFFHDICKPDCFKLDENGRGHFKGHAQASAQKAVDIMKRLKFSNKSLISVATLIRHHSDELESEYKIKRLLSEIGLENMLDLLDVQRADSLSKQDFCRERLKKSDSQEKIIRRIVGNGECISIKQLEVNGNDMIKLGFKGYEIKEVLSHILDEILNGNLENDKETLVNYAKQLKTPVEKY